MKSEKKIRLSSNHVTKKVTTMKVKIEISILKARLRRGFFMLFPIQFRNIHFLINLHANFLSILYLQLLQPNLPLFPPGDCQCE